MQTIVNKAEKLKIEKQIIDWKMRVAALYSNIETWLLNSEYKLKNGAKLTMYEELMAQFEIPATAIETKNVYKEKAFILTLKPRGLWIIGANGRIDVLTTTGNYILMDFAAQYETPQWKLFNGVNKNGIAFTKPAFLNLLK